MINIEKISQWPYGTTHAVLGVDNTFFMGSGPSVWIFDATDHSNPVKIGEENFEDPIYGLATEGNYLYVANEKLRIVDISDLNNPVTVGTYSDCSANDVKVSGDYAYVVGDEKLQVIDISVKSNPIKVGECVAGSKRLDISGNYAFVAAEGSGLIVINISDPANPTKVGNWIIPSGHRAFGVKVKGNYAFVADYPWGVWAIDISNLTNPVDVSFAGGTSYGTYEMDNLDIKGDYAYASCWYRGLIAIDISDPTNISIAREIPSTIGDKTLTGYNSGGVSISGNYAYMGGQYHGAGIYDIFNPTNEILLKIVDAYGRSFSLAYRNNYAYVTTDNGLVILDISDTSNPVFVSKTSLGGRSAAVTLNGDYAYVGATWAGLGIVDVSDPLNLQVFNYGNGFGSSVFHNGYLHALHYEGYSGFYLVLDVSNPANVKEISRYSLPSSYTGLVGALAIKDNYAFIGLSSKNGVIILDISNPETITEAATWLSGNNVNGITIQGNYIYVRTGSEIIIGDISDITNPVEVDSWSFSGQYYISTGPHLWQNYLFIAGDSGVLVFDVTDPSKLSFLKQYDEVTDINDLYFTENGFIYTAAYEHGVYILKFTPEEDYTPPIITNVNAMPIIHSAAITWNTDEFADSLVKYGTSPGSYTMQEYNPSFELAHFIQLSPLVGGKTYYYVVSSTDFGGNTSESIEHSFTTDADVSAPVIVAFIPSIGTEISGGTISVNVTITTDEPAWCQYSISDFSYGDGVDFTVGQGTTEHSFVLELQDGESYTFYYHYIDAVGNSTTISTVHTFTVATRWWDYFDDITKIESYTDIIVHDGTAEIALPDNTVSFSKDAGLYSVMPDNNWDDRLQIAEPWRTVIGFTMPSGMGEINSIKLHLYKYETAYGGNDHTINIHKLDGTFVESSVTWNYRSTTQEWALPGGDYDSTVIDHYVASGDIDEWFVWTIRGEGADNPLDSLTWGDTIAFILEASGIRSDKFVPREGSSNVPYVTITLAGAMSGTITSKPIAPTSISSWNKFNADYSTPAGTSITFSILNAQTDAVLCSGLTGNEDDISSYLLGVSAIKLKAYLTTTNSLVTPILYSWDACWNEAMPECPRPISFFTHNAQHCI